MRRSLLICLMWAGCSLLGSPDADGDGFSVAKGDCDDTDAEIGPGMEEECDEVDNDCDGEIDNDPVDGDTFYIDEDDDGYGTDDETVYGCEEPDGFAHKDDDCDDDDDKINPGEDDTPNKDRDCDGEIEPPTGDDDDDDDVVGTGILEATVSCSGTEVTFSAIVGGLATDGMVFSQETASQYEGGQWADNHDLEVVEVVGEVSQLERTLADGTTLTDPINDYQRNVSTVFPCFLYEDPNYMTYAFMIFDESGGVLDCLAFGHDPDGMIHNDYNIVGEDPDFDLSLCRFSP